MRRAILRRFGRRDGVSGERVWVATMGGYEQFVVAVFASPEAAFAHYPPGVKWEHATMDGFGEWWIGNREPERENLMIRPFTVIAPPSSPQEGP